MFPPCHLSGKKRDKERRDRKEKDPFKVKQKKKKKKKKKSKQYCKTLYFSVASRFLLVNVQGYCFYLKHCAKCVALLH